MDLDYLVLSVKGPARAATGPSFRRRGFSARRGFNAPSDVELPEGQILGGALEAAPGPDAVSVESTTLSEAQALDAARDPNNVVAPVMPVSFIAPCLPADYGIASEGDPIAAASTAKSSWGIGSVGADRSRLTGAGVTIAVLDTGIDHAHPSFAGVNLVRKNFSGGNPDDTSDRHGHGTHCAGTIFGRDVDGVRIGVARGVNRAVIGKVLDDRGRGTTAGVLKAMSWAGEQGANVISMSLGFDFPGMQEKLEGAGRPKKLATSMALKAYRENLNLFETLVEFLTQQGAENAGVVIVAASGNESMRQLDPNFVIDTSLPAAASAAIISVGAIGRSGAQFSIAPFSNVNPTLCGPGVDIVSAKPGGGLVAMSGTSMACPHVAGLAALWWQERAENTGRANAAAVRARVVASAVAGGFDATVGFADRGEGRAMAPA